MVVKRNKEVPYVLIRWDTLTKKTRCLTMYIYLFFKKRWKIRVFIFVFICIKKHRREYKRQKVRGESETSETYLFL